jgi:hypothetical protein
VETVSIRYIDHFIIDHNSSCLCRSVLMDEWKGGAAHLQHDATALGARGPSVAALVLHVSLPGPDVILDQHTTPHWA